MNKQTGKVYLVGAGPGDPGLFTLKGVECMRRADVIVYDYLAGKPLLVYAAPDAELVYVGKKGGDHTMQQEDICQLLVDKGLAGHVVTRLKGGDSFIFGRGGEEALALHEAESPLRSFRAFLQPTPYPLTRHPGDAPGADNRRGIYHRPRGSHQGRVNYQVGQDFDRHRHAGFSHGRQEPALHRQ